MAVPAQHISSVTSVASITSAARVVPARDRVLPVDEPIASLLPDGGLRRGWVVGCEGPAAVSLIGALTAAAAQAGSWVLLVGFRSIGLEALAGHGVPLHRVVAVDPGPTATTWAERVIAGIDGFELVVSRPPRGAGRVERRIRQRLQARGAVLVTVDSVEVGHDIVLSTDSPQWAGLERGYGRLAARRLDVTVSGRRIARPVSGSFRLPGPDGRVEGIER
ncbi:MAG: hypothetical protein ACO225_05340 [Ilumatobacteraceae bacterium]